MSAGDFRREVRVARERDALGSLALCLVVFAALGSASAASAKQLALGSDGHGVRLLERRGLTFVFTSSAAPRYGEVAGRTVDISCDRVTAAGSGWIADYIDGAAELRAPVKRAPISTGSPIWGDLCSLGVLTGPSRERVVAIVPLTVLGLDYLSQEDTALEVESVWARPASLRTFDGVILPTERSMPPPGKLGLYDRGGQEYVAKFDRAGVRVFIEAGRAYVTTDMIAGYLLDTAEDRGPYPGQTLTIPPERMVWVYAA